MRFEVSIARRDFLQSAAGLAAAGLVPLSALSAIGAEPSNRAPAFKPRFGMVTYMWGADWDLPTLLANCKKAGRKASSFARNTHMALNRRFRPKNETRSSDASQIAR